MSLAEPALVSPEAADRLGAMRMAEIGGAAKAAARLVAVAATQQ